MNPLPLSGTSTAPGYAECFTGTCAAVWVDTLTARALTALPAVTSFVPRASFILWLHRVKLPTCVQRAPRFVPAAVFTALFVPELAFADGALDIELHNAKLIAGCTAIGAAWMTRNPLATIAAGKAALHLARNFLGT